MTNPFAGATLKAIKSLRPNQRHVLDCIAIGQDGGHHPATLKKLVDLGLIVEERQRSGAFVVTRYGMPIHVHIVWCEWCAEEDGCPF